MILNSLKRTLTNFHTLHVTDFLCNDSGVDGNATNTATPSTVSQQQHQHHHHHHQQQQLQKQPLPHLPLTQQLVQAASVGHSVAR